METSNVAMALVTLEGTLDVVNRALCELLQYDEATLKSKTWQELTPPRFLQVDLDNTIELLSGRLDTYRTTKQFIRADGRLVWVDLSASCCAAAPGTCSTSSPVVSTSPRRSRPRTACPAGSGRTGFRRPPAGGDA